MADERGEIDDGQGQAEPSDAPGEADVNGSSSPCVACSVWRCRQETSRLVAYSYMWLG